MRSFLRLLLCACVLAVTSPVMGMSVQVKAFLPDGSLQLEDGSTVRLADIIFPDSHTMPDAPTRPFTLEVVDHDRYGTAIAYLTDDDGGLLQHHLVQKGLALAYSPKKYPHTGELLALPVKPKWIIDQSDASKYRNHYRVVSGIVRDVAIRKNQTYLNFGDDWKSDFTVMIPKAVMKRMDNAFVTGLKNKHIFVRGYIHDYYGPRITLFDPLMLEADNAAE